MSEKPDRDDPGPRRRRRKGGGLRVPSDNVPRRSTQPPEHAAADEPDVDELDDLDDAVTEPPRPVPPDAVYRDQALPSLHPGTGSEAAALRARRGSTGGSVEIQFDDERATVTDAGYGKAWPVVAADALDDAWLQDADDRDADEPDDDDQAGVTRVAAEHELEAAGGNGVAGDQPRAVADDVLPLILREAASEHPTLRLPSEALAAREASVARQLVPRSRNTQPGSVASAPASQRAPMAATPGAAVASQAVDPSPRRSAPSMTLPAPRVVMPASRRRLTAKPDSAWDDESSDVADVPAEPFEAVEHRANGGPPALASRTQPAADPIVHDEEFDDDEDDAFDDEELDDDDDVVEEVVEDDDVQDERSAYPEADVDARSVARSRDARPTLRDIDSLRPAALRPTSGVPRPTDDRSDELDDGATLVHEATLPSAVGATLEPGDPSDSGELLTDDFIEEFEVDDSTQPQGHTVPEHDDGRAEVGRPTQLDPTLAMRRVEPAARAGDPPQGRAETLVEPVEEIAAADLLEVDEPVAVGRDAQHERGPRTTPPPAPKPSPPPPPGGSAAIATAALAPAAAAAPAPARAGKRRGKPWFEEIFDEDYLRTLPFLTPRATQKQAQFVIDALGVEPGSQVLDVGCGYGRHAMELAARGHHVVGLDLSLPLLIRGADEAQRRGLTINFVHGDMREIQFESQFDGAYCLFSTFGYFDDETNKKVAKGIARALKPGGRLVLEVLNRDYIIGDLPSRVWWEGDGCVVLEEVEFNYFSSRVASNRSVVFDDGRQLEQEISVRAYSLHELGKLLHAAGFRILEVSGGMDTRGRFFGPRSREAVIVAEKRPPKADGEGERERRPTSSDELG